MCFFNLKRSNQLNRSACERYASTVDGKTNPVGQISCALSLRKQHVILLKIVISRQSTYKRHAFLRTSTRHKRRVRVHLACLFQNVRQLVKCCCFDSRCSFRNPVESNSASSVLGRKQTSAPCILPTRKTLLRRFGVTWCELCGAFGCTSPLNLSLSGGLWKK